MRIGSISNNPISILSLKANQHSNENAQTAKEKSGNIAYLGNGKNASPLQKMLVNLQEQIRNVEESNDSADDKAKKIKALEEQIDKLQQQIAKEQTEKITEKKETEEEKEDPTTEKLREKGFSVVSGDFVQGMISSSGSVKLAAVARTQYVIAKAKHDEAAMSRAMDLQTSQSSKAQEEIKSIKIHKKSDDKKSDDKDQAGNDENASVNQNNNNQDTNIAVEMFQTSEGEAEIQQSDEAATQRKAHVVINERTAAYKEAESTVNKKQKKSSFEASV